MKFNVFIKALASITVTLTSGCYAMTATTPFKGTFGLSSTIGLRPTMEDAHDIQTNFWPHGKSAFFAVYDGHGGDQVAHYLKRSLFSRIKQALRTVKNPQPELIDLVIRTIFRRIDQEILTYLKHNGYNSGSTAAIALVLNNHCFLIWCGDSRALVSRNGMLVGATVDHKPNSPAERQRLEKHGGSVINNRLHIPHGSIAVSRAFGDPDYKLQVKDGFIAAPSIKHLTVKPNDVIVVACDGLWDVYNNSQIAHLALTLSNEIKPGTTTLSDYPPFADDVHPDLKDRNARMDLIARAFIHKALNKASTDNISVIVANYKG